MFAVVGAPESIVFVSALLLTLLIGAIQLIGFGSDLHVGGHADIEGHAGSAVLSWLGVGTLPLMIVIVVFLTFFGVAGLMIEQVGQDWLGSLVSPWIAAPAAIAAALPLTGFATRALAHILPQDFTTAVSQDMLVGEPARIVTGQARHGFPARARVEDSHGQSHYVMVEPNAPDQVFEEGEAILLIRREATLFRAISRGDHRLPHIGA